MGLTFANQEVIMLKFLEARLVSMRVFSCYLKRGVQTNEHKPWEAASDLDGVEVTATSSNRERPIDLVKHEQVFSEWTGLSNKDPVIVDS